MHVGYVGLLGAAAVAMAVGGGCKWFTQDKVEQYALGDEAASTVAWSMRLPETIQFIDFSVASTATGEVVVAASMCADVEIGGTKLPPLEELAEPGETSRADIVVWKMDAAGKSLWAKRFGGSGAQRVKRVVLDPSGNVIVAGSAYGSIEWGGTKWKPKTGFGGIVGQLDPDGNPGWSVWFDASPVKLDNRSPGDQFSAQPVSTSVDASGRVYVLGTYHGALRVGGKPLVADVGDAVGGTFLVALDPSGAVLWHQLAALPEGRGATDFYAYGDELTTTRQGRIIIAGSARGEGDFAGSPLKGGPNGSLFLSGRDSAGKAVWTQEFPVTGSAEAHRIVEAKDGGLFLAGAIRGSITIGPTVLKTKYDGEVSPGKWESDLFVARLDANGKPIWAKSYTTVGFFNPVDLAMTPGGGFVLALTAPGLDGKMDVGGGDLLGGKKAKGSGLIVAGYSDAGEHRWSKAAIAPNSNTAGAVVVTSTGRTIVVGSLGQDCTGSCEKKQLGDAYVAAIGP